MDLAIDNLTTEMYKISRILTRSTTARATYAPHSDRRRSSAVIMPSGHRHHNVVKVLNDESDFEAIASRDGYISICGFGSLLSEKSARSTFPDLINFRIARLTGFRRVFTGVGGFFFVHGIANAETEEIAGLSVEPCEGETIIITAFEINKSEIPAFIKREREYRFLAVVPETLEGKPFSNEAVLCSSYTDEEFFKFRCQEGKDVYFQQYGEYKIHKIWRDDVLPCRVYLRHCVVAAKNLGDEAYNNFLDHTFLGDRKTSIRQYLETLGKGIMEEEPPESLKTRYGG
ncbi:Butirosin biosynthesis [Senna tora]|uniref:Butirosin biosynthesis n=1 Tax=Senna tora TaxID=362788 RepID=A0A834TB31_9FABA|nr:Butirosin biosynthesis [Senna tora]